MLEDGEKGAILQVDRQSYAVAPHLPCGVVTSQQLRKLADVADKFNAKAIKVTSASRIAIVGLAEDDIDAVWNDLDMNPGAAIGLCVRSIKACPGTTFCKRAHRDSLAMGMFFDDVYHGMELPGKMKIGVSGCINQCAESSIKDIGLVGRKEGWDIYVGGCAGARPRLAEKIAIGLSDDETKNTVEAIILYYKENAKPHERLGRMIDRIGVEELTKAVTHN